MRAAARRCRRRTTSRLRRTGSSGSASVTFAYAARAVPVKSYGQRRLGIRRHRDGVIADAHERRRRRGAERRASPSTSPPRVSYTTRGPVARCARRASSAPGASPSSTGAPRSSRAGDRQRQLHAARGVRAIGRRSSAPRRDRRRDTAPPPSACRRVRARSPYARPARDPSTSGASVGRAHAMIRRRRRSHRATRRARRDTR